MDLYTKMPITVINLFMKEDSRLCRESLENHILFSKYDIGGAEELYFSDCCRRGVINARIAIVCMN